VRPYGRVGVGLSGRRAKGISVISLFLATLSCNSFLRSESEIPWFRHNINVITPFFLVCFPNPGQKHPPLQPIPVFPVGLAHIRSDLLWVNIDPAQALAGACIRYWLEVQDRYHASEMNRVLA